MKKKIVILGAGESGAGSAVLAQKQGFDVFVSDKGQIKDKYKEILDNHNIRWEEGNHNEEEILSADEVIKSPGIPENAPLIIKLHEKGIPVISEIEFAGQICQRYKNMCNRKQWKNNCYKPDLSYSEKSRKECSNDRKCGKQLCNGSCRRII